MPLLTSLKIDAIQSYWLCLFDGIKAAELAAGTCDGGGGGEGERNFSHERLTANINRVKTLAVKSDSPDWEDLIVDAIQYPDDCADIFKFLDYFSKVTELSLHFYTDHALSFAPIMHMSHKL